MPSIPQRSLPAQTFEEVDTEDITSREPGLGSQEPIAGSRSWEPGAENCKQLYPCHCLNWSCVHNRDKVLVLSLIDGRHSQGSQHGNLC